LIGFVVSTRGAMCLTRAPAPFSPNRFRQVKKVVAPMSPNPDATSFIAAADLSVKMREAVDLIVENGALQRIRATEACAANPYQPNLVWAPSIFGTPLELDLREEVCAAIYSYGVFDAPLLAFLSRTLKAGDTFLDVGAHIGFFTVAASMLVGEQGRVVSFEPMPETFNRLTVNARNTGRSNITLVNAAAWHEDGEIEIQDFGPAASAFNSVFAIRRADAAAAEAAPKIRAVAYRLDNFLHDQGIAPRVVKIDVESAEAQVIAGLGDVLSGSDAPILIVEVGDFEHLLAAGVPSSTTLLNGLTERGYSLHDIGAQGLLVEHRIREEAYTYMNVVCLPKAN
jgi:FkbM family methyltransferase